MAKALLEFVAGHIIGEVLVDGYCGSGFFGHALASGLRTIIGIDWNQHAIDIARESARANEIYICGDIAETIPALLVDYRPQTVLLDPPADGLGDSVTHALATELPNRLIYVSCDPATLARDLANLRKIFRTIVVQPIDMFPQTAEIETVAVLERPE
jgi:23S rRNA (uracil1939-C5)-methyltransferase